MLHNAAQIAELFSARWVVMGHTHQPIMQAVSASASYVNLGSWGEDDPPDERVGRASPLGTFLVLRKRSGEFLAELMRWDQQHGPQSISSDGAGGALLVEAATPIRMDEPVVPLSSAPLRMTEVRSAEVVPPQSNIV
jgi:hypothetical protein